MIDDKGEKVVVLVIGTSLTLLSPPPSSSTHLDSSGSDNDEFIVPTQVTRKKKVKIES
jgi:hypothetical protein